MPLEFIYARLISQDSGSHGSVELLKTDSVDAQRLHVLAVGVTLAGAEVREDLGGEFLSVEILKKPRGPKYN